jgi:hypothetical protein
MGAPRDLAHGAQAAVGIGIGIGIGHLDGVLDALKAMDFF